MQSTARLRAISSCAKYNPRTPHTLLILFQAQYYLECGDSSPLSAATTRRSVSERTRGNNKRCTVKFWGVATRGSLIGGFDSSIFVLEHENTYPASNRFSTFMLAPLKLQPHYYVHRSNHKQKDRLQKNIRQIPELFNVLVFQNCNL